MKKIILLAILFGCSSLFAQKFSIKSDNGNIFYLDQIHRVKIKVEGYDSSKVSATASKFGVLKGRDGWYIINLREGFLKQSNIGDSVIISVFVAKGDENYMVGSKTFYIARENNFEMGFGSLRAGDDITVGQLESMGKMEIVIEDEVTRELAKGYKVVGYSCMIVPKHGEAEAYLSVSDKLSDQVKASIKKMGLGTKVLIDDIQLKNENGELKRGSPMYFTIIEKRGTHMYPFMEWGYFSIEELSAITTVNAQVGEDSPNGGDVYKITNYELLLVPVGGDAESFSVSNDQFTEGIRRRIKEKLKPGDKILIDNIRFIRPDGTTGVCPPIAIFIK